MPGTEQHPHHANARIPGRLRAARPLDRSAAWRVFSLLVAGVLALGWLLALVVAGSSLLPPAFATRVDDRIGRGIGVDPSSSARHLPWPVTSRRGASVGAETELAAAFALPFTDSTAWALALAPPAHRRAPYRVRVAPTSFALAAPSWAARPPSGGIATTLPVARPSAVARMAVDARVTRVDADVAAAVGTEPDRTGVHANAASHRRAHLGVRDGRTQDAGNHRSQ
jgi:hypothetical protein